MRTIEPEDAITMRIPNATYRIQFNPGLGFRDALAIVGYLADLGVHWIYASPIFAARRGSAHGYDVIDPNRLNPELGSEADFNELVARLQEKKMGWLQDTVPNHMAYTGENSLLADLFELGEHSAFASFFDIHWGHPAEGLSGRVAAPFLGDPLDACIKRGEIQPVLRNGTLGVAYYELFFPLRLSSYALLDPGSPDSYSPMPEEDGTLLAHAVRGLIDTAAASPSSNRDIRILEEKEMIRLLVEQNPEILRFVNRRLEIMDPKKNGSDAVASLTQLLSEQVYRLRYWKTATREINYRRFFDINELICLRQERREVFDHTHQLLKRLVSEGKIDGLRVDHVDGLRFPGQYLQNLRKACGDIYLVVEKILGPKESLLRTWPVQGTTGYEFADRVTRLFCRSDNQGLLDKIYRDFSGRKHSFDQVGRIAKRQVLKEMFAGDLFNLVESIRTAIPAEEGELEIHTLTEAVREVLIRFPVYRTYGDKAGATGNDADLIREVFRAAAADRPDLSRTLNLFRGCLLGEEKVAGGAEEEISDARAEALSRFQQLCAPLAAKGVEDTALYRFHRLGSLNEVGGDPSRIGISLVSFHSFLAERAETWPHSMNALSSHDSKRSEDVRARLNVLSELPDEWRYHCTMWRDVNRDKKGRHKGAMAPDANVEYLLYQTVVGAFPFEPEDMDEWTGRIRQYMVKACREAKEHTSWLAPDDGYEKAICRFIDRLLTKGKPNLFLADFVPFARKVARFGVFNSLAQTLIKITAPGLPDIYQGTELFDFSLVDPDNRRPVDFVRRKALLEEIRSRPFGDWPGYAGEKNRYDRMKLYLVHSALQVRKQQPMLFQKGRYLPLEAIGRFAEHVIAFARVHGGRYCVTVVPRWLTEIVPGGEEPLGAVWEDTVLPLPEGDAISWTNAMTGERYEAVKSLPLQYLFGRFPTALLIGESAMNR